MRRNVASCEGIHSQMSVPANIPFGAGSINLDNMSTMSTIAKEGSKDLMAPMGVE